MAVSNLEVFAKNVAAKVNNISPDKLTEDTFGFDWTEIVKMIETIAQIVSELMNNCQNKSALVGSIKSPTWFQRVYFRTLVKDSCDCCGSQKTKKNSGKLADAMLAEAQKLTDKQISDVVSEVLNADNLLI